MAALQNRNGFWRVIFEFRRHQHAFTIGKVDEVEARQWNAKAEFVLMRIKQHLLDLPAGTDIVHFIQHDGKIPLNTPSPGKQIPFAEFRDAFLNTFSNGALEDNTLYT